MRADRRSCTCDPERGMPERNDGAEMIAPINADNTLPAGARCQEASHLSRQSYIACRAPATHVIWHDKDRRGYYMCDACADHNVRNRGGRDVTHGTPAPMKETITR
jgi:hypothetical protein